MSSSSAAAAAAAAAAPTGESVRTPWMFSRARTVLFGTSRPVEKAPNALKIGILGAANIAPLALIHPAKAIPELIVYSVAARDEQKAKEFAAKYHIPKVHASYEALLEDPEIQAVYIPSPNALHHKWTIAALRAGKHVLCEKPLSNNEREAREMVEEAAKTGKVLMEAFHYRYHPVARRAIEIVQSGELGELKSIEVNFLIPSLAFKDDDIRFNLVLGGGALMDCGCYTIHIMRHLAGKEPLECTKATVTPSPRSLGVKNEEQKKEVDGTTVAEFKFENDLVAKITCTLNGSFLRDGFSPSAKIVGTKGSLDINNFVFPSVFHSLHIKTDQGHRVERPYGDGNPTYFHMLKAFVAAVVDNKPMLTPGEDGIKNMRVIDMVYTKAGLTPRGNFD